MSCRLLRLCGPQALANIFRVEVDGLLLGQMLQAMQQQWRQHAQQQHVHQAHTTEHTQEQQQTQQQQDCPAASLEQQQQDHLDSSGRANECGTSSNMAAADCSLHSEAALVLRMLQSLTGRVWMMCKCLSCGSDHRQCPCSSVVLLCWNASLSGSTRPHAIVYDAGLFDRPKAHMPKGSLALWRTWKSEQDRLLLVSACRC